ncbi:hypothetical protein CYMTET_4505 [Cymbomonas tetramitiformis]|uniref:Uncharacterized protein n=1 Tax=Cymbomonas tetramitiformis TaxID=36881 RepID=A0AAE0H191_9CHLO|nr:hypothetical protein CYMTET_4505 [Cymbomonas tetramitiformis]
MTDGLRSPSTRNSLDEEQGRNSLLEDLENDKGSSHGTAVYSTPNAAREVFQACMSVCHSWASKKFMSGCAILFPITITVYVTFWFLTFFDKFFSPLYQYLFGFHVFGLGFITSMVFIFLTGVFVSSWLGGALLWTGEWFIHKLPIVGHVYSASKQISQAVNPDSESSPAFREFVLIRHPRHGEYAFAFITGECVLQSVEGDVGLFSVFVPTNHIYVGDVFLLGGTDIFRTNLSVREGIEIVVSGGMALPATITPLGCPTKLLSN